MHTTKTFKLDVCSFSEEHNSFFRETRDGGQIMAPDMESHNVSTYEDCMSLCHLKNYSSANFILKQTEDSSLSGQNMCELFQFGLQSPRSRIVRKTSPKQKPEPEETTSLPEIQSQQQSQQQRSKKQKHGEKNNTVYYFERVSCSSTNVMPVKKMHQFSLCDEIRKSGQTKSGLYEVKTNLTIYGNNDIVEFQRINCEMDLVDGGWTVFQQNLGGFPTTKTWDDYKYGFGDLSSTFWLGNEVIHQLTRKTTAELLVELEENKGEKMVAFFNKFEVSSEQDEYKLSLADPGNESFVGHYNGTKFMVKDAYAGWWYCTNNLPYENCVFLNGDPEGKRIKWYTMEGYRYFKSSRMFFRRKQL